MQGRQIGRDPAEVQAEFLDGIAWAFFVNGALARLMTRDEMEASIHIMCGKEGNVWHIGSRRMLVRSPRGVLFKFEKVL